MNTAHWMRALRAGVSGLALLALVSGAQAQVAYRAGSSASAVSSDVQYAGSGGYAGANSGNIVVPLPGGWQVNDFWLALIESRDNVPASMPSGWTLHSQASGAGGTHQASLYWRRAQAGDTAPTVTHPGGGPITAKIVGFRRVDLEQPFDVPHSLTASAADTTTEAASITTQSRSMLVLTAHAGGYGTGSGSVSGSSPWHVGTFSMAGSAGNGASVELRFSNMVNAGAQASLTLTRAGADSAESHGVLLALRPDRKLTVARPATVQANDVMIVSVGLWVSGAVTAPAGWTLVRSINNGGGALQVYLKVATGSEPASYTWTVEAVGGAALGMQVFSGVDGANPIDAEAGQATASGLAHATPSVTTTLSNTMLVSSHMYLASNPWSPPAGMTETVDVSPYSGPVHWGLSLAMSYAAQPAPGGTGARTATVPNTPDIGFTHLLALRPSANLPQLHFVQVDHLNTPRLVENAAQQAVWRWEQWEPFGLNPADENPSGLGAFEFPLRFPGQYADKETNLHYNYFRDYDPLIGRYVQSDPIGLRGGINTYAYVWAMPLNGIDPFGLDMICGPGRNKVGINPDGSVKCVDNGRGPNEKVCATAACAAGIGPLPAEMRTQSELDQAGCKLVCGLVGPGGPIPTSLKGLGMMIGTNYVCNWICKPAETNVCRP